MGSDAAIEAMPLKPCSWSSSEGGEEDCARTVPALSRPLVGLALALECGEAFRLAVGPRDGEPAATGSPNWRRGFATWGGGAGGALLTSSCSTMRCSARRPNAARSLAFSSMAPCGSNEMSAVERFMPPPKVVRRTACGPPANASATSFGSFGAPPPNTLHAIPQNNRAGAPSRGSTEFGGSPYVMRIAQWSVEVLDVALVTYILLTSTTST